MTDAIISRIQVNITQETIMNTMSEVGHAIAEYIVGNTIVTFSWSGQKPNPGAPPPFLNDPVTSYSTTDLSGDFELHPTGTNDPVQSGIILGTEITQKVSTLLVNPNSAWTVPPITLLCPTIVLTPSGTNNFRGHWTAWCSIIVPKVLLAINPSPLMGSHGSYTAPTGSGAVMTAIV